MDIQKLLNDFWRRVFQRGATAPPLLEFKPRPDGLTWGFAEVWNQSLTVRPERPVIARDYVWASEIGGAMIDRYLKMTGVPQSNAPNTRSLRKFQAGDIWEWICALVLKRAGILIETQKKLNYQYPGLLRVSGKLDFLAGGQPDWRKARRELQFLGLPEMLHNASLAIINRLETTYGYEPLKPIVLEIKSTSSFMYQKYEETGQPNPNHRGQIFHYLKAEGLTEGHIVYVCKNDCQLLEFGVFNPSLAEDEYIADLRAITGYIQSSTQPPYEQEILFDDRRFRFEKNWKIEYSNYLTHLYGYKTPMEYRERVDKRVSDFTRVLKRCAVDANMTKKNQEVIQEARQWFPEWDTLVDRAREAAKRNPKITQLTEEEIAV